MNFSNFTLKAQESVQKSFDIAKAKGQQAVECAHVLKGIISEAESITDFLFGKMGVNKISLEKQIDKLIDTYPKVSGADTYISSNASEAFRKAEGHASAMKDKFVTAEHLLMGILDTEDITSRILKDHGISMKEIKAAIAGLRKGSSVESQSADDTFNSLGRYAINLNEMARSGRLDPVIGRDDEIRRILQILTRRTKNNPLLIGEPGVGKTAIAEGLAHRIIRGDVPEDIKSKTIFSLDMGALIAGAKYKGEFEERLKSVVNEVIGSNGDIVLFIDEIHTLVGAGKSEGAMDAANILKPALARGELRAIGATTLNEYQKYFEKDKALERRFQVVMVDEPGREDAISILRGVREKYETHHKVIIRDEAIIAAVDLSSRYITDRFLPDKAIDLIDEAASRLRLEMNSVPEEIDEAERTITRLEIEKEALRRDGDTIKVDKISRELAEMQSRRDELKADWRSEKEMIEAVQVKKEAVESLRFEAEKAERSGDYGKVAEIRYGKIVELEKEITVLKDQIEKKRSRGSLIQEEVRSEDVASIVSKWTGIPVSKMLESEKDKLLRLEDELHKRVVGQDEAIAAVSDAVRRSRAGLQDKNRPVGSFIFLGTTGVGKTELARALAEFLFNDENLITRIDMSEYQERHSVSRLIGAPPGYIGYDEGGQLTEAVRHKPYSVVLLDEIEKAHPDLFNLLLQVLDEGRLTDNKGRTINFRNVIVIMTSNLGSDIIRERMDKWGNNITDRNEELLKNEIFTLLRRTLKPEFLNRVDEIVMFRPLNIEQIREIVQIQLKKIEKMVKEYNLELSVTDAAIGWLTEHGYDPQSGARPVKRLIQREIVNELSKEIIGGKVSGNDLVIIDEKDGRLTFAREEKK
ncbi:MAG: ATP-dependent chaperone ClpB [Bacteroidetes bacterium GWE2_41_25]|nr:MAG: ATP-dependent chaperone ClpB [Bacteroidetes bacterium GWA2_40_15]OFX93681.1 MAG: ATP-dependent chaperone ClpB [Bacteroidetes bacterium GWC2_40_22]OFY01591.1 MAG: ATP-dependent chaperone ClpB [Bacteroidetes bacterium GWE2_41_25]OFY61115.1 MAG: ATP-dependent chaperone ClpB [Bacteroidetes bacterium GWF2_41_9]HCU19891.1 ATP-dependent chaperone ClpB [Bacteroidales bacterium]